MLRNEKGVALGAAMLFMVAVGVGSFYVMKTTQQSSDITAKEVKDIRARAEAQKVFSMAGFLISNNLILCKSAPWGAGSTPLQCRWGGLKNEKTYKPNEFGFTDKGVKASDDSLTFNLIDGNPEEEPNAISRYKGSVKFYLVDVNKNESLRSVVGEKSDEIKAIDNDHYVVKVDLELNLGAEDKNNNVIRGSAIFKRPIAIPHLTVIDSECISLCNASKGEHPYPACRGPFTIDANTKTDVIAVTENLGPGALYDLDYERSVTFKKEVQGVNIPASRSVEVPLNDYLEAGNKVEWVDQVECGTFVKNVSKTVSGRGPDYQTQEISQHSEPAGKLNYKINVNSKLSNIEPFRLNSSVLKDEGSFKGKLETNTTVYVVSPH